MRTNLVWRSILAGSIIIIAFLYSIPTFLAEDSSLRKILPQKEIKLGLDLRGGVHLTIGVDVASTVKTTLSMLSGEIRNTARDEKIIILRPELTSGDIITLTLLDSASKDAFQSLLVKDFPMLEVVDERSLTSVAANKSITYSLKLSDTYKKELEQKTLDQAVKTIRNRIDQFGVAEPDIRAQEGFRIQIQLPGLQDTGRALDVIKQTAHLEFKSVDEKADPTRAIAPLGREIAMQAITLTDGTVQERPIVLYKDVLMTGEYISDARVQFNPDTREPEVLVTFNKRGATIFERITTENLQKQIAIVLDGKVHSAPVVQAVLSDHAVISGGFTDREASDLALVLRAGALPAPVEVLEQRAVGPTLGQESIDSGVRAAVFGLLGILIFMLVYYRMSGFIADIVLILNIVLLLAGLALFGATLTLPGIAGIILTIGMAIDANIIIYERIREELRAGSLVQEAVKNGYDKATLTILDANITTIIAAIILYQFGTGPVRGFAVTLSLGILSSIFTTLFVSHIIFDLYVAKKVNQTKLSI